MQIVYRDSVTGELVTETYAKANKATTQREVIRERFSYLELERIRGIVIAANTPKAPFDDLLKRIEEVMQDCTPREKMMKR